jgi:hypothetical protein
MKYLVFLFAPVGSTVFTVALVTINFCGSSLLAGSINSLNNTSCAAVTFTVISLHLPGRQY